MKTTNFEISKKLKEIGFEARTLFYWTKAPKFAETDLDIDIIASVSENRKWQLVKNNIPSYDLETLIEALPASIKKNEKMYHLLLHCNVLGYYTTSLDLDYDNIQLLDDYMFELYKHDESLADTAGRLLIKLFEAGIINFKK